MTVSISRCVHSDVDDVRRFIDEHWKHDHVLATSRELFDWQYRDRDGAGYALFLARRNSDAAVIGLLGYIPTRRFDAALSSSNVVWLSVWKVRDDGDVSGLGLQLLRAVRDSEPHCGIGAVGLNPATTPIYRALGYRVGELDHYVFVNERLEAFRLARLSAGFVVPRSVSQSAPLDMRVLSGPEEFASFNFEADQTSIPVKSGQYFRARYAEHPFYRYSLIGLADRGRAAGLLAVRTAEHAGTRALRIVDYAGETGVLTRIGPIVQRLLTEHQAEYADLYNAGIDPAMFQQAGFARVDPDGPDIVPDHFEPFEARNVRLWYSFKGSSASRAPVLFKGDADQDRPNRLSAGAA
jgi:hypothetical protein